MQGKHVISPSTELAGTSTSTPSSTASSIVCDAQNCGDSGCAAGDSPARSKRERPLSLGRLATPKDYLRDDLAKRGMIAVPRNQVHRDLSKRGFIDTVAGVDYRGNMDQFISEEITKDGQRPLLNRQIGRFSSALAVAFDAPPNEGEYYPSVSGLEGCTSVVIIGEKGCWISHFWEAQSFEASDEIFQNTVIHSIEEGDDGSKNMKSPFNGDTKTRIPELADGEGESPFKPQIFISTPNDGGDGYLFNDRLTLIEQVLVGPGRAFEGIEVKRRGYTKRPPDTASAHGKVLIQYTNDQTDEMGDRIKCPQTAIYRLWFEDEKMADHEWPAAGDQIAAGTNNRKRQDGSCGPENSTTSLPPVTTSAPSPTSSVPLTTTPPPPTTTPPAPSTTSVPPLTTSTPLEPTPTSEDGPTPLPENPTPDDGPTPLPEDIEAVPDDGPTPLPEDIEAIPDDKDGGDENDSHGLPIPFCMITGFC
ncbi:hypothetical protein G7Y79_00021g050510 [Physcia stellaris]|nr:hypothetical protein G7Y79_00021g050510 [Physcia stellaris]